jgi:hypothetical protein
MLRTKNFLLPLMLDSHRNESFNCSEHPETLARSFWKIPGWSFHPLHRYWGLGTGVAAENNTLEGGQYRQSFGRKTSVK